MNHQYFPLFITKSEICNRSKLLIFWSLVFALYDLDWDLERLHNG